MKKLPAFPKPLETEDDKYLFQAECNLELWEAAKAELLRLKDDGKKHTKRQLLEFGLQCFLLKFNPKAANQLGIFTEEK